MKFGPVQCWKTGTVRGAGARRLGGTIPAEPLDQPADPRNVFRLHRELPGQEKHVRAVELRAEHASRSPTMRSATANTNPAHRP